MRVGHRLKAAGVPANEFLGKIARTTQQLAGPLNFRIVIP